MESKWCGFRQGEEAQAAGPESLSLRVAILDRDRCFLRTLSEHLETLGWTLQASRDPVSPSELLAGRADVAIVDITVLGPHWDKWLVRGLQRESWVGTVVCTGESSVGQRVHGLNIGADSWITKPCEVQEISARLSAIVRARRAAFRAGCPAVACGADLEVRPDLFDAVVGGRRAGLTRREYEVMLHLARRAGDVVERRRLCEDIWGTAATGVDRPLNTIVRKIRVKLGRAAPDRRYIHTHRGVGYRLEPEREDWRPSLVVEAGDRRSRT